VDGEMLSAIANESDTPLKFSPTAELSDYVDATAPMVTSKEQRRGPLWWDGRAYVKGECGDDANYGVVRVPIDVLDTTTSESRARRKALGAITVISRSRFRATNF